MLHGLTARHLAASAGFLVSLLVGGRASRTDGQERGGQRRRTSEVGVKARSCGCRPGRVVIPAKLTLAEATRLFRTKGLDLLIADTTVETAHGALLIARGLTNPAVSAGLGGSLGYNAALANAGGGPGSGGASAFTWNINVSDQACLAQVLFGKHGLNVRVARWAYEAAKMDRLDAQRTLEGGMRQQYAQTVLAKVSIQYAKDNRQFSGTIFDLVKNKFKAGAVSDANLAAAETDTLETEQAIAMAESNYYLQKVTLTFLLGSRSIASEYDLDDAFLNNKVTESLSRRRACTARAEAFEFRPDLKSIE